MQVYNWGVKNQAFWIYFPPILFPNAILHADIATIKVFFGFWLTD